MKKRLESLDIIKGIAMIMVILVHYNQMYVNGINFFTFGQMGCQIFIVASGFGIALSLSRRLKEKNNKKEIIEFYKSRVKGIAPAWWLMMIVVYLANTLAIKITGATLEIGTNRTFLAQLCNALFLNGLLPFCNNNVMPGGWYIGTSMLLYLIAPIIYFLFKKFKDKKIYVCLITSVLSILSIITLAIIAGKINPDYFTKLTANNSFGYFSILTQFPCFCLGILLYNEYKEKKIKNNVIKNLILGSIILILGIYLFLNPITKYSFIFCATIVGLASYFILKSMIAFEEKHEYKHLNIIKAFGQKSLYIFLPHAFFAYTFTKYFKKLLYRLGIVNESYIEYFFVMIMVVVLSYISGIILEKIVNKILEIIDKIRNNKFKTKEA